MEILQYWTDALSHLLSLIAHQFGVSDALAIILLTLAVRLALMPIAVACAARMQANRLKMDRLKPELERLRQTHKDQPKELAAATMSLYRQHGVKLFDRLFLLNIGSQAIFGIGLLQVLRNIRASSSFLWIANITRPDFLLTLVACILMSVGLMLAPETSSQSSMMATLVISVVITIFTLAAMPSTVGLYWATSNAVSIGQSLALRALLRKNSRRAIT
jgi:YidC/Oxa1 family membrane protein insertase